MDFKAHNFVFWSILIAHSVSALVVEVKIPRYKLTGDSAKLSCHFALDGETLYSLKWYKGDSQFYQYIPANPRSKIIFPVDGVNVDADASSAGEIQLTSISFSSDGKYKCEVITEAPKFATKFGEGNMTVIVPPSSVPQFEGANSAYRLGDTIAVNCTAPNSRPPAEIQWFINRYRVVSPVYLRHYSPRDGPNGLKTSVLGIAFTAVEDHFNKGQLHLRCRATISHLYTESSETTVIQASYLEGSQAEESRGFFFFNRTSRNSSYFNHHILGTIFAYVIFYSLPLQIPSCYITNLLYFPTR